MPNEKSRTNRSRLPSFKSEKEALRQCFLFSNHLIIATRTSGGRLHLVPEVGKIPLADALLIEDPSDHGSNNDEDESSVCSTSSQSSDNSTTYGALQNRDFKIIIDIKGGAQSSVHLAAPTIQEKAAWISDISQVLALITGTIADRRDAVKYHIQFSSAWTMYISMTSSMALSLIHHQFQCHSQSRMIRNSSRMMWIYALVGPSILAKWVS